MATLTPVLDAPGVNALLRKAFPDAVPAAFPTVTEVAPGRVRVMAPYREGLLRPGGVISGPTLMPQHLGLGVKVAGLGAATPSATCGSGRRAPIAWRPRPSSPTPCRNERAHHPSSRQTF